MKYYKYLDLDHKVVCDKIRRYIGNKYITTTFWNHTDRDQMLLNIPELQTMFDPLGIHIRKISILNAWFMGPGTIHVDDGDATVRINLPILNCDKSVTNFYRSKAPLVSSVLPNGVPYFKVDPSQCELVDSFCLNRPAAIRIGEPHQVELLSKVIPRISCTIEFEENIEYLLD